MDAETEKLKAELLDWHERFAACVRARDFIGGKALFAPDCQCFGTCAPFAADLENLLQKQWQPIWSSTHSFKFLPAPFEIILSPDGLMACVLALWESQGVHADGTGFPRGGRCTPFCAAPIPILQTGSPCIRIIPKRQNMNKMSGNFPLCTSSFKTRMTL